MNRQDAKDAKKTAEKEKKKTIHSLLFLPSSVFCLLGVLGVLAAFSASPHSPARPTLAHCRSRRHSPCLCPSRALLPLYCFLRPQDRPHSSHPVRFQSSQFGVGLSDFSSQLLCLSQCLRASVVGVRLLPFRSRRSRSIPAMLPIPIHLPSSRRP